MKIFQNFLNDSFRLPIIIGNVEKQNRFSTSLTGGNQVSPLSLPAPSEVTGFALTPPQDLARRGLFSHHFSLPFLTQLKSQKASQDDPFWRPKSTQDRPKTCLETIFVRKRRFSRNIGRRSVWGVFSSARRGQDRPKMDQRRS